MTFAWRPDAAADWLEISEGDTTLEGFGGPEAGGAVTLSAHWVRSLPPARQTELGFAEILETPAPSEDAVADGVVDVGGVPTRAWSIP